MATPEQAARLDRQDPTALGARVRDARRFKELGQSDVAVAVGVSISYISRIEAGKRRCDVHLLSRIADALSVSVDSLLGGEQEPQDAGSTPKRPLEIEFALVALEMGDAPSALQQLNSLELAADDAYYRDLQHQRGRALEQLGQLDDAVEVLERIELSGSDPIADVLVATTLSRCYRESGEFVRAIRIGESALDAIVATNLTGADEAVQLAVTVAASYFEQGDREYAVRLCRRTLAAAEAFGTPRARASAYWNSAIMDHERGDFGGAVHLARRALALLSEGQDDRNLARLQGELGLMELRLSPPDLEQAETHLSEARRRLDSSSGSWVDVQHIEAALARLDLLRGEASGARSRALAVSSDMSGTAPRLAAEALVTAGEASLELGDQQAAHQQFLAAVRLLAAIDAVRSVAQLWLDLGAQLQRLGDSAAAADAFQRAAVASGLTLRAVSPIVSRSVADSHE